MAVQKTRNFSHLVIYSCWKYGAFTAVKNNGKFLTYAWNAYHLSWKGIQQGYNFSVKNSMYKRVTVGLDLATESSGIKVCGIPTHPPPPHPHSLRPGLLLGLSNNIKSNTWCFVSAEKSLHSSVAVVFLSFFYITIINLYWVPFRTALRLIIFCQ